MTYVNAVFYQVTNIGIYAVKHKDTEHHEITKFFLDNTSRMLRELFDENI